MSIHTEVVFTFSDTRNAITGEKMLQDAAVAVRVMPRPAALGSGCGICLRVDRESWEQAVVILRTTGVGVTAAFIKSSHAGKTTYTPLALPESAA